MRVLIIKTVHLDELILSLPVLDYLHSVFRGIEVDWLVDESCREPLAEHPLISRLLVSRWDEWRRIPRFMKNWREIADLKGVIQERRYDMVFDLEGTLLSGIVSRLTRCRRRYGFDGSLVAEPVNLRFDCNRVPMRRQDRHCTDRALRMVSVPFGKDYAGHKYAAEISIPAEEETAAALFMATLSDGLVFLFHTGGGAKSRLWHESGWIELGDELLGSFRDATILISGGGDRGVAERIAQGIGRQTRLLPALSFHGLAAIMKKVDLVIGGDCPPLLLAAALGTPTVSFFRATDGSTRAPRGELHRFIQSPMKCSPCLEQSCDNDAACRESIKTDALTAAVRSILIP